MFKISNRGNGLNLREYDRLIRAVKHEEAKLRNWILKINRRASELRAKMELYKNRKQMVLAGIYAKEAQNLILLREALNYISLKFLAVSERLDTLRIVLKATLDLKPLLKSLNEIYPIIQSMPVNAGDVFKQLVNSYSELLYLVSPPNPRIVFKLDSIEAAKILQEVEDMLQKEVLEKFPSIPLDKVGEGRLTEKIGELVEVFAADGGLIQARKPFTKKLTLKDKVLRYIKLTGKMDVYGCARFLNTSPQKVVEILYELAEEGKVKFNSGSS